MSVNFNAQNVTPLIVDQVDKASEHLSRHLRGRLHDARLTVSDDGVVIRGRTKSYYVKQLAQHAVMKRVDLPIAANEIAVQA